MLILSPAGVNVCQQKAAAFKGRKHVCCMALAIILLLSTWPKAYDVLQGLLAMPGVAVPFPVCLPAGAEHDEAYDEMRGQVGGYSVGHPITQRLPDR